MLLYHGSNMLVNKPEIIGSERTVEFMIKNVDSKKRNTGLKYKMK